MTPRMTVAEIVDAFNAASERDWWTAVIAGSRSRPAITFNSTSAMVSLKYFHMEGRTAITFTKTQCSFGDFVSSAHHAYWQVMTALKAAGVDVEPAVDPAESVTRFEYDPKTRECYVHSAKHGSEWVDAEPMAFKDTEIILPNNTTIDLTAG